MTRRQAINALIALSFLSSNARAQTTQRSYTVKEIDELRSVVQSKYISGHYNTIFYATTEYFNANDTKIIEELVRTWMLAGKTAEDLRNSENDK